MVSNGGNPNFEALSYKVNSIFLLILKKFLYNFHKKCRFGHIYWRNP